MSQTFQPGEHVTVTICGIVGKPWPGDEDSSLRVHYSEIQPGIHYSVVIAHPDAPSVTVERVAPPEWPPQAGDLWRDRSGDLWLAADVHDIDVTDVPQISMVSAVGVYRAQADTVSRRYGPMTLVHREQSAGGGDDE